MINKTVRNAVLGCNLENDRMISVRFQGNLEKGMATHSSILAQRIPWTEEPSQGHRVKHD